ncbi:MAG: hypothetical protein ACD_4C00267G0007 [uncultured bacterium (gcode 4)]|uniref:Ribosomal RNA large subunit methyltransferase H n=1 Tax=uncultured bacterium (gcode 4) TaxID=1234023 RepID=K2G8N2_9BACT|nr:MAG: hypothetical protein ACD_4C00267G0007 [uncultured bacterium (gcode 4)]
MIRIIEVSDSFSHFLEPIKEYEKRLKWIEIHKIKPENKWDSKYIIKNESLKIKKFLEKDKWFNIYLDILWEELDTMKFYEFIEKIYQENSKINIIIWGAYWIDLSILWNLINKKISLSKMTFPHSLALLLILEQIYRIENIKKNTWYHH